MTSVRHYSCIKGVVRSAGVKKSQLRSAQQMAILPASVSLLLSDQHLELVVVVEGKRSSLEHRWLGFAFYGSLANVQRCFPKLDNQVPDLRSVFELLHRHITHKFDSPYLSPLVLHAENNDKAWWQVTNPACPTEVLGFVPLNRSDRFHNLKSYPLVFVDSDSRQPHMVMLSTLDRNALLPAVPALDARYTAFLQRLASAELKDMPWNVAYASPQQLSASDLATTLSDALWASGGNTPAYATVLTPRALPTLTAASEPLSDAPSQQPVSDATTSEADAAAPTTTATTTTPAAASPTLPAPAAAAPPVVSSPAISDVAAASLMSTAAPASPEASQIPKPAVAAVPRLAPAALQRSVVANVLLLRRNQLRELDLVGLGAPSAGGKARVCRVAHIARVPAQCTDDDALSAAFDDIARNLAELHDLLSPGYALYNPFLDREFTKRAPQVFECPAADASASSAPAAPADGLPAASPAPAPVVVPPAATPIAATTTSGADSALLSSSPPVGPTRLITPADLLRKRSTAPATAPPAGPSPVDRDRLADAVARVLADTLKAALARR